MTKSTYETMTFLENSLIEQVGVKVVNSLVNFIIDNGLSDRTYYKILTYLRNERLKGNSDVKVLIDTIKANILNGTLSVEYYNPIEDNK